MFVAHVAAALAGVPRSRLRAADVGDAPARIAGLGGGWGWGTGGAALEPFTPGVGAWPWARETAMTIPTISRARNLICSTIGSLPIVPFRVGWDGTARTFTPVEPVGWMDSPDPTTTRTHIVSWTVDDLIFHGRAWWYIAGRYASGFPSSFRRMPYDQVRVDHDGVIWWHADGWTEAVQIPDDDVVEFLSPIEGLLAFGGRALSIAVQLDCSAERYATTETPSGWLKQTGGEPMGADELDALVQAWHRQRMRNQTAALNEVTDYVESSLDPARLQLTEARDFQGRELANLANVPPYLVGAPNGGGLTYTNAQESRALLLDYGAIPYVNVLEQTLSRPAVTPAGQIVRFDLNAWLRSPLTGAAGAPTDPQEAPADA